MSKPDYEYTIITDDHAEDLISVLNGLAKDGWRLVTTIQEHAYTKFILEREKDVNP